MTQPGFFKQPEPMTLGEIAALTGAQLADPSQAGQTVSGTSTLDQAGPRDLAFFDKRKYGDELNRSHAGACLVSAGLQADVPGHIAVLRVANPYAAFVEVARVLYADTLRPASSFGNEGIADHGRSSAGGSPPPLTRVKRAARAWRLRPRKRA